MEIDGPAMILTNALDAVYADVKASIRAEWGIEERSWGTRELVLRDPNGYFVTFWQPK